MKLKPNLAEIRTLGTTVNHLRLKVTGFQGRPGFAIRSKKCLQQNVFTKEGRAKLEEAYLKNAMEPQIIDQARLSNFRELLRRLSIVSEMKTNKSASATFTEENMPSYQC